LFIIEFHSTKQYVLSIPGKLGRYTNDELFKLCTADPDLRIEHNANCELFLSPIGSVTSTYKSELVIVLGLWNRKLKGRMSDSNGGCILQNGAVRAPDVAWVSKENLIDISKKTAKVPARLP
jgi:Uma2 family endonuclease